MRTTLSVVLAMLGVSAIMIALSMFVFGADATVANAERAFTAAAGSNARPDSGWPVGVDSELRFYAVFWGAYGVVLLVTAKNLTDHLRTVPWLAGLFFLGGVGRALSRLMVGTPHPFFLALMAAELVLPLVIMVLWSRVQKSFPA